MRTIRNVSRITRLTTPLRVAPRAIRIPISRVCLATRYDNTP